MEETFLETRDCLNPLRGSVLNSDGEYGIECVDDFDENIVPSIFVIEVINVTRLSDQIVPVVVGSHASRL